MHKRMLIFFFFFFFFFNERFLCESPGNQNFEDAKSDLLKSLHLVPRLIFDLIFFNTQSFT